MRRGEMWPSVLSRRSANDFSGIRSNVHSDVVIADIGPAGSDVNKDMGHKAKAKAKDLRCQSQ